jgi:hypothetical protein
LITANVGTVLHRVIGVTGHARPPTSRPRMRATNPTGLMETKLIEVVDRLLPSRSTSCVCQPGSVSPPIGASTSPV